MKNSYLYRRYEESRKKNIDELPLAYIWDRIAAFVLDLLIIGFVSNIVFAPFKRKIQAAILNEHDGAVNVYVALIILGVAVLFILYHTFSVFLFQRTIGKKVFNIRVESIIHGQSLTLFHSFVRACSLFASIVFFFFPLLEVFSNRLRRPMHDRLADTYVMGMTKTGSAPSLVERFWMRILYVVVLANVCVVIMAQILFFKQGMLNISEFVTHPEYLCDAVSEAQENWPKKEKATRLDIALALYSSDTVDETCLEKEAQRAISYGEELDKAYLGKAFVYENKIKVSDRYLKKVCETNSESESCLLTQIIEMWSKKDWKSVDKILAEKDFKSPFLKVWAIKHYDKVQNYEKLLGLMEGMWPNRSLNEFIGKYKATVLWKQDKISESKELFQSLYSFLPESRKISFASDICNLELESGCSVDEFVGCKILVDQMKNEVNEYIREESLLTYIKTNKCGMTDIDDIIAETRMYVDDPKIQMYMAALKAKSLGKQQVAEQIFKNILKTSSSSSLLSYEARSQLIELLEGEEFAEQVQWWLKSDTVGFYHQRLGEKFLRKMAQQKKWHMAEPVAQKLMSSSFKGKELTELMVVVFYNLKRYNIARNLIEGIERTTRSIASNNSFEGIKKELMKGDK